MHYISHFLIVKTTAVYVITALQLPVIYYVRNAITVSYSSQSHWAPAVSLFSSISAPLYFCCSRNEFIPASAEQTLPVTTVWLISSKLKPIQQRRELPSCWKYITEIPLQDFSLFTICVFNIFSERELFAICCRQSVGLSVVCNARAPYSGGPNFQQCF